ncbi:MAG: LPS export ABC transporter periplasmic protein LptC [Bdellovibrionales bacterium]
MAIDPQQRRDYVEEAPATHDPLSFIRPRERRPLNLGHSRAVRLLRKILPVAALLILAALIAWPMLESKKIKAIAVSNIPDLVIKNLHLTGTNDKNEPYSLMAEKTTRPSGLKNIYDLDHPQGEITLANGSWVAGKALYGRFDQDTRHLWLGGNVELFGDNGSQFTTDEARIDLKENNAWGEKPVLIQGSFGEIRGNGFRLMDSGKVLVVTGKVRAVLDLRPKDSSDKPASSSP